MHFKNMDDLKHSLKICYTKLQLIIKNCILNHEFLKIIIAIKIYSKSKI